MRLTRRVNKTFVITRTQTTTIEAADEGEALDRAALIFSGAFDPDDAAEDWTVEEVTP